jgi:hypothetical protein
MRKRRIVLSSVLLVSVLVVLVLYRRQQQRMNSVLERIESMDASLTANSHQYARDTANTVRELKISVWRTRNQPRDVAVLRESMLFVRRARSLGDTLRQAREELRREAGEAIAGKLLPPGRLISPDAEGNIRLIWHLNRYQALVRRFAAITVDKTRFTAERLPLAAALARLTDLERQVRQLTSDALQTQAAKLGSYCGFTRISAAALEKAFTVTPGATYEADLLMTQSDSYRNLTMSANGKPLAFQPNGEGLVTFRVPPWQPGQPDTIRAQWQGAIRARTTMGDTTWRLTVPYLIIKPSTP